MVSSTFVAALSLILAAFFIVTRKKTSTNLPPSPPRVPILGNALSIPKGVPTWEAFEKFGKDLNSDIFHMDMAGTDVIVLNSYKAAKDLLDARSTSYSSRPRLPMVVEVMGWDWAFAFMPYGKRWIECNKLFHNEFKPTAALRFRPLQLSAIHRFMRTLLVDDSNIMEKVRVLSGSIVVMIAFGLRVQEKNDPILKIAQVANDYMLQGGVPGAYFVDAMPLLKYVPDWFPGAGFKRYGALGRKAGYRLRDEPFAAGKAAISNNTALPSFLSACLDNIDEKGNVADQEMAIKSTAATMYSGGADTTVSTIGSFILAMLANPKVQEKAHAEIDSVCKRRELPTFDDMESLPYITAIVKEVLRFKNVAPLSIPHFADKEDVYRNYHIPKGSIVISNLYAMLHDETFFPNSHKFDPDRHITTGPDGKMKINPDVMAVENIVFGFGRRECPGQHMAFASVWMTVCLLLSAFRIEQRIKPDGTPVPITYEYGTLLGFLPEPFECHFEPRYPGVEELINNTEDI